MLRGDIHSYEKSVWFKPAYRLKFLARSLLHPVLTLNWLYYNYIASHPQRAQMLYAQMALPDKLQWPYLSSHFSAATPWTRFVITMMPWPVPIQGYIS
ncbi:MAG: DUF535 family protein [Symbiopectobacterium sp.]